MFDNKELEYIYNCLQVCHEQFDDLSDMADIEQSKENARLYESLSAKILQELHYDC